MNSIPRIQLNSAPDEFEDRDEAGVGEEKTEGKDI